MAHYISTMNITAIKEILKKIYGWHDAHVKQLVGYDTLNYKVQTEDKTYVLKVYPYDEETLEIIKGESQFQKSLQKLDCEYPLEVATLSCEEFIVIDNKIIRCLTFLEGTFLVDCKHTENLISHFGHTIATLNLSAKDLFIPSLQGKNISWDLSNAHWSRDDLEYINNTHDRSIIDYFLLQFNIHAKSIEHTLPKQIIHNDANDWNVLCEGEKICGIIDFGDATYSTRISEIAVALSYVMVDKDDPIHIGQTFLRSYHEIYKLTTEELDVLYYFIASRICISLISSAKSHQENPDNEYISVSEKGYWSLIHKWLTINPIFAKNKFRTACGFPEIKSPRINEILSKRNLHTPAALSVSYQLPIHMTSAAFQYMYGADGSCYLDAYNNIPHVGHEHPKVVAAAQKQIATLNTNTRYLYDPLQEYSEKLLAKFPDHLDQVFFVNSGSAASDLAVRLARNYTQREQLIVMEHGYHGNTQQGIAISHYKYNSKGGAGKINDILEAPLPNTYVDGFNNDSNSTGERYAANLIQSISKNNSIAAFIAEPISGCGGQIPLADNYLKTLYPFFRQKGILTISYEVQTGFGRLGNHFWGYEMHGIVPDIIILGKPMGNGHPMGAVVTTKAIADAFNNGMEFFSSFGGNPVSCVIGSAVLDVIENEKLQDQANISGQHFFKRMKAIQSKYNVIGDVRGSGLFLGIEIIYPDSKSYQPYTDLAKHIKNEMRNKNTLVSTDGPYDNVIKMKPPLCFSPLDIDTLLDALESILSIQK